MHLHNPYTVTTCENHIAIVNDQIKISFEKRSQSINKTNIPFLLLIIIIILWLLLLFTKDRRTGSRALLWEPKHFLFSVRANSTLSFKDNDRIYNSIKRQELMKRRFRLIETDCHRCFLSSCLHAAGKLIYTAIQANTGEKGSSSLKRNKKQDEPRREPVNNPPNPSPLT